MPYALFENDEKLSRAFPTESEAWQRAEEAGLVEGPGQLEDGYVIKPCPPDPKDQNTSFGGDRPSILAEK